MDLATGVGEGTPPGESVSHRSMDLFAPIGEVDVK
jgi:hypothetical protein